MAKLFVFKFRQQSYLVTFKIGFSILCLCLLTLCCILGTWQLQRYTYKKNIEVRYMEANDKTEQAWNDLNFENLKNLEYQKIRLNGKYIQNMTFLLQNRYYKDRVGYDVLTAVQIPGDTRLLLVDRGWIAAEDYEKKIKNKINSHSQKISGYIKFPEYQFILGKNILDEKIFPLVIQRINFNELSRVTHQDYYPFILRLDAKQANGFIRDWVVVSVPSQRHLGYAVQWFVLAMVLVIAYVCFCCERIKDEN